MAKSRSGLAVAVLVTALAFVGTCTRPAAEEPRERGPEETRFEDRRLTLGSRDGIRGQEQADRCRRLSKQLSHSVMQQQGTMSAAAISRDHQGAERRDQPDAGHRSMPPTSR